MPNLCAIHLWLLRAAKMGTLSGAKITSSAASATHLLTADTLGQSSPSHLRKLRVCVRITSGAKLKSPLIYNLPQKDSQDLWGSVGLILQIAFQKSWSHRWSYFILKLFPVGRNNTKSPVIFIYIFYYFPGLQQVCWSATDMKSATVFYIYARLTFKSVLLHAELLQALCQNNNWAACTKRHFTIFPPAVFTFTFKPLSTLKTEWVRGKMCFWNDSPWL